MFCNFCGKQIDENNLNDTQNKIIKCPHCNKYLISENYKNTINKNILNTDNQYYKDRMIIGFLCAFFGLLGLVIGLALYPNDTNSRKTFVHGWICTSLVLVIVEIFFIIFLSIT